MAFLERHLNLSTGIEIIVVDSSQRVITLPAFVQYIRVENLGPSHARNTGARKASGEWIVFCDADDFINPYMLQIAADCGKKGADAVFFEHKKVEDADIIHEVEESCFHAFPIDVDLNQVDNPVFFLRKFFPVHSVLIRRSVVEVISFEESQWFIEEIRFYLELAVQRRKLFYCSENVFCSYHRTFKDKTSLSSSNEWKFWEGIYDNYDFLLENRRLNMTQRLRLVQLVLINYHCVDERLKSFIKSRSSVVLNWFWRLPNVFLVKVLFDRSYKIATAARATVLLAESRVRSGKKRL